MHKSKVEKLYVQMIYLLAIDHNILGRLVLWGISTYKNFPVCKLRTPFRVISLTRNNLQF